MTRNALHREIQCVHKQLNLRQNRLDKTGKKSALALRKINPLLMIAAGLCAGALVGSIGWRKLYSLTGMGISSYPLLKSSVSSLEGMGHD